MKVVEKAWGKEEIIVNNKLYCLKKLYINEDKYFSLQYHKNKHETFFVEKGELILEKGADGLAALGRETIKYEILEEGDTVVIPQNTIHRCRSVKGTSIILEASTFHEDSDTYKIIDKVLVIASGYFDPIHAGHIEYLEKARKLGDRLIVILNNDEQAALKKGKPFMGMHERGLILKHLQSVSEVLLSIDTDATVCKSIGLIHKMYKDTAEEFIFAKGGDRYNYEIPESTICKELNIEIIDGLGEKIQSSSALIERCRNKYVG